MHSRTSALTGSFRHSCLRTRCPRRSHLAAISHGQPWTLSLPLPTFLPIVQPALSSYSTFGASVVPVLPVESASLSRKLIHGQIRLLLRRQQSRRQRQDEGIARRQGGEPRRDVPDRPARAGWLHDHYRGLHLLLRPRQDLSARAQEGG